MAGLVPAIHVFLSIHRQDVDARDRRGHDQRCIVPRVTIWPNRQRRRKARPPAKQKSRPISTRKPSGRTFRPQKIKSSLPTTTRRSRNCAGRAIPISTRNLSGAARMSSPIRSKSTHRRSTFRRRSSRRRSSRICVRQTKERTKDAAPQFDFFHDFNGLPEGWKEDATQSYYHDEGNWSNRMILGDSLLVMASLAEREGLRGKVQCIYFDPPYGIKFNSNWQPTTNRRDVKDANLNSVSREPEVIRAFRDTWTDGVHSYLGHFRDRIVAARDMLHQSGSIFVQIGDGNVHRVRAVLDEVFGDKNFVSLITVLKTSGAGSPAIGTNVLASVADYIVCYAKDLRAIKYRQIFLERKFGEEGASQYVYLEFPDGSEVRSLSEKEKQAPKTIPAEWHIMAHDNLTSQTGVETTQVSVSYASREFSPNKGGWKTNALGLSRLEKASRFLVVGNTLRYRRRFNDFNQRPINDVWSDFRTSGFSDPKMYVVQTNPGIVARCVLMSTDPGDLVLDPTCGSGTTAYVAEQWGRRWITIDTSRVALTLARARLMGCEIRLLLAQGQQRRRRKGRRTDRQASRWWAVYE